jgi:NAD(P)H dehydrogenase (quinone)
VILVTGASGALGGLILDRLTTVPGVDVVAGSRSPVAGARRIDFDRPSTLVDAFGGVDVLVFVSAGAAEDDVVLDRHGSVIRAAAAAGVRHVIYTSLVGSGDRLTIALAHRWTEARLAESLFDFTILRNGLYAEIPARIALAEAESAAATGVFRAPLGCGRMSVVAREDLAEAAAQVAVDVQRSVDAGERSRHAGRTYELAGVTAVGGKDIATALAQALERRVRYEPGWLGDTRAELARSGLEPYRVGHTMSMLSNVGAGLLESPTSELPELLGRPPTSVTDLIVDAVKPASRRAGQRHERQERS